MYFSNLSTIMFGISYGELFLLVGATAALVGTLSLFCAFWILMGFLEISIFLSCGGPKLYGNVVWKQTIEMGF